MASALRALKNQRPLAEDMSIQKIAVLGAGQMGNGITQVAACAGFDVIMLDIKQEYVDRGISSIEKSLAKLVSKERMTQQDADAARARISSGIIQRLKRSNKIHHYWILFLKRLLM